MLQGLPQGKGLWGYLYFEGQGLPHAARLRVRRLALRKTPLKGVVVRIPVAVALSLCGMIVLAQESGTPAEPADSENANTGPDETWSCWEPYDVQKRPLVTLTLYRKSGFGTVQVAGDTQAAQFQIQGFNRRWDFGHTKENGAFSFAFLIEPNGDAAYYDFTRAEEAEPSQIYRCRQL